MHDIRDDILRGVRGLRVTAAIVADDEGIVAGTGSVAEEARALGLTLGPVLPDGTCVRPGDTVLRLSGTPKQVVTAEDRLIGAMAKFSGIATAARRFVDRAGARPEIVSGAWKKMPGALKEGIRSAIVTGGARARISPTPFVYLDKTYVRILGGVRQTLEAVAGLEDRLKVVQLKGRRRPVADEAVEAAAHGAGVLFVDTGRPEDIRTVGDRLRRLGLRDRVKIAFGGNVRLADIDSLKTLDVDLLDVGREIVDARLLDMRLDVVRIEDPATGADRP